MIMSSQEPLDEPSSLGEQINASTRKEHARVNRMIVSRLSQALPPHAEDATKYLQGIMGLASLYYVFEKSLWDFAERGRRQIEEPSPPPSPQPASDAIPHLNSDNFIWVANMYSSLNADKLLRSPRLFEDAKALMKAQRSCQSHHTIEALRLILLQQEETSPLKKRLEESPHLLIAHMWSLYLACHSGGQIIGKVLRNISLDFWLEEMKSVNGPDYRRWTSLDKKTTKHQGLPDMPSAPDAELFGALKTTSLPPFTHITSSQGVTNMFSFWEIRPGEPTKSHFKEEIIKIQHHLSDEQRREVISEAKRVFEDFEHLIESLDIMCGTDIDNLDDRIASLWFRGATKSPPDV